MLLVDIAIHVYTPKLTSDHSLPHSLEICVSKQLAGEVDGTLVNAIMELDAELPRQVVVTINQAVDSIASDLSLQL